jgi:putative effector of murein hydrolase
MTEKAQYWLGIILSYAVGLILTIPFFVVVGVCRLSLTACGVAYDTFMFTPRVVNSFIYRHYEKEERSNKDSIHLN